VAFLYIYIYIYIGSLGTTLVPFEYCRAILQTNISLKNFFIFFPNK
jgi:hypothetical protein